MVTFRRSAVAKICSKELTGGYVEVFVNDEGHVGAAREGVAATKGACQADQGDKLGETDAWEVVPDENCGCVGTTWKNCAYQDGTECKTCKTEQKFYVN